MAAPSLIDPADPLERQNQKLTQIIDVLMRRVERAHDDGGAAYSLFQRAVLLEDQVRERTRDLERTLDLLNESNARLAQASRETERARSDLANAIETIQEGFALFDGEDRLVLCNSRFAMHMPDILETLVPGVAFADYIDAVSRSRFLHLPEGQSRGGWRAERMGRHGEEHVLLNVQLTGDRWIQVSEHHMAGGQTVIMQTDVSDILRAEREERGKMLDDQARLIRATLEHINQGVGIFDHDKRLVGFNQRLAAILSLPLTRLRPGLDFEAIFRRFEDELTFGAEVTPATVEAWVNRTTARPPLRFEIRRGESQVLDVFAQEMPDRGFVISFTDVSVERKAARALSEANERLEQRVAERTLELQDALSAAERANATRSRFVAAASHDLLQPLSAAKLFLSSIDEDPGGERQRETLGKAQNALLSVEDMIHALLDISKLESGRATVQLGIVDLAELLAQLRDEFTPLAEMKGLTLIVVPSSLRVETDARYLRRILQNLIGNAVRYTASGRVLVGVRHSRRNARIEIWDTGPGIPESEHENIFREFHRLNARASSSEGLGLGLAIVERACALLGHPLALDTRVGRGTGFKVTVPIAGRLRPAVRPKAGADPATTRSYEGLVLLLVENDQNMLAALCQLLEAWEVQVLPVRTAAEAVALIDETGVAPDAILADFQLDDGATGCEAIERLRHRTGPLGAGIITARRGPEVVEACRRAGAALLHKPVDPSALHRFLDGICHTRVNGPG